MPNSFFQFKQFTIHQDQCAMKVSTDSCLFGAWLSKMILPDLSNIHHALDIGAGTGLLMLMVAQDHSFHIDGIEINEDAYKQALLNINQSPWSNTLRLINGDVKAYKFDRKFDFIFSNPPFYENDLLPPANAKASAMHETDLTISEICSIADIFLNPEGCFAILIPYFRLDQILFFAEDNKLYPYFITHVHHEPHKSYIRSMIVFGREKRKPIIQIFAIKNEGQYTDAFTSVLKDFYLNL